MAITNIGPTLETTWMIQLQTDGTWHFESQAEYETEGDIDDLGTRIYGGTCTYRAVRIDRTVGEPHSPQGA